MLLKRIVKCILKQSYATLLLFGILLLVVAGALALYVHNPALGIGIALVGGFFSGSIICSILPKYIKLHAEKFIEEVSKQELETDNKNLKSELDRLRRMKVNVSAYQPMLKLGLLQLDMTLTDFMTKEVGRRDTGVFNPKTSYVDEYMGVLDVDFKANLGVDLEKLLFVDDDNGNLIISGLCAEYQGKLNEKETWRLKEVRRSKGGQLFNLLKGDMKIGAMNDVVFNCTVEQRTELQDRINNGFHFGNIMLHTEKMAEEVIRLVLAPLNKNIVFLKESGGEGHGFLAYLQMHNMKIDNEIKEIEAKESDGFKLQPVFLEIGDS